MSEVRKAYNRYSVALYSLQEAIVEGDIELVERRTEVYQKNKNDYVNVKLQDLQSRLEARYEAIITK